MNIFAIHRALPSRLVINAGAFFLVVLSTLILITLVMSKNAAADTEIDAEDVAVAVLQAFSSDGCSEFPDGTLKEKTLWLNCCIEHDRAYWIGGSRQQRYEADEALKDCVAGVGEPEIAAIMLAGVRVGGSPYWPTRFRWGYGWPYWDGAFPRGYKVPSKAEQSRIDAFAETPETP